MEKPRPGSFGLSIIGGKTGKYVAAGQAITGDGSRWTHAFIVVDNDEIVEGMPHGARVVPLSQRIDDAGGVVFSDRPVQDFLARYPEFTASGPFLENVIRSEIIGQARNLVGTPYSFLDYLALALAHFGIRADRLRKFMLSKQHMICSQLVDEVYRRVGIHIFDDDRLPMDVTPGDLANRYGLT